MTEPTITLTRDQVRQLAEQAIRMYHQRLKENGHFSSMAKYQAVNEVVEAAFAERETTPLPDSIVAVTHEEHRRIHEEQFPAR